jgi:hypothetical protein
MRRSGPGSSGAVSFVRPPRRGRGNLSRLDWWRCLPHPTQFTVGPGTFRSGRCGSPERARTTTRRSSSTATWSGCRCLRASREATGRTARSSACPMRLALGDHPVDRAGYPGRSHRYACVLLARRGGPGASGGQDGSRRPGACFAAPLLAGERGRDLPRSGWAGGRVRVVGLWGGPDLTEHHELLPSE